MKGKVAFVTGAARGQGRSHAVAMAREGADIIAIDLCEQIASIGYPMATPEDLEVTVKEVEAVGGRIVATKADVREYEAVKEAVRAGVEEFGRLDVVIANAGIIGVGAKDRIQSFRDIVDVNLNGAYFTVQATKGFLIEGGQGGSIVLISSVMGLRGAGAGIGGYVESKHGVVGLMRSTAIELAPQMIRVNSLHPTNVGTPMILNDMMFRQFRPDLANPNQQDAEPAFASMNLMPVSWLEPEDVSNAILFLVSDAGRYITGATLPIDAGALLR